MWPYIIAFVILAVIALEIVIMSDSKKAHYRAWKQEFERHLGEEYHQDDEIVIRELFEENHMDVKRSVDIYRDIKSRELDVIWNSIDNNQKTELLNVDEIMERYDLTKDQKEKLKEYARQNRKSI